MHKYAYVEPENKRTEIIIFRSKYQAVVIEEIQLRVGEQIVCRDAQSTGKSVL